jgi:5-oxoprolinase (ATP-hydrolysing)
MQSSGGLTDARRFRGPHAILSGPAGGVVAYAHLAERAGIERAIGFDMGGTSTDVSRFDGEFERVYETETAGVRIRAPMMAIHTVAAGGGSLCRYDGYRLTVGPESAGARPGPLCYGHADARELTVTDVNLALGRLCPDRFPFPLGEDRIERSLATLVAGLRARGFDRTPEEVAAGFYEIANANMAEAIRQVSVVRGYDVREYTLVVFGGAAGQHACAIARRLGIRHILSHPYAGVLSAYGMGLADVSWHGDRDLGVHDLETGLEGVEPVFEELEREGSGVLTEEGFPSERVDVIRRVDLRYRGTETALTLASESGSDLRATFEALHRQRFGYARPTHPVEAVVARVEVIGRHVPPGEPRLDSTSRRDEPRRRTRVFADGEFRDGVPVFHREDLTPGHVLQGPALVLEATGTLVVDPGFELRVDTHGRVLLEDRAGRPERESVGVEVDPVQLEIFNNLYMSIAEQMGTVLRRTALSTNIRERLDFSCAVFDPAGGLAMCSYPTIRPPAALTCPMSPSLPRSSTDPARCASSRLAGVIMRTSVASLRGRCRPSPGASTRRGSSSAPCESSPRGGSKRRRFSGFFGEARTRHEARATICWTSKLRSRRTARGSDCSESSSTATDSTQFWRTWVTFRTTLRPRWRTRSPRSPTGSTASPTSWMTATPSVSLFVWTEVAWRSISPVPVRSSKVT